MKTQTYSEEQFVSVVIPNYNGEELLAVHLPTVIKAQENLKNNILEIIIVDDASTDSSIKVIKNDFPQVKLVRHRINRGFSAAVNTGARTAKGAFIALLNTDVSVTENFLLPVLRHFENENIFAVSLHEKGFGWARPVFENGYLGFKEGDESDTPHKSFWVNGGSGVFKRSMWMDLGGMDEKLFSPFYWEDIDLCYRAQKRGWRCLWEPKAHVIHEHEATTKKLSVKYKSRIQERNQLLFIWKNITSSRLIGKHIVGLLKRLVRHPGYFRIFLMAIWKFRQIIKSRRKEVKECKVSDEAILADF